MEARDVLEILSHFDEADIEVWVEGGWGIDALMGAQNRDHGDLDVMVDAGSVDRTFDLLARLGFEVIFDEGPGHYSFMDGRQRIVDVSFAKADRYGDRWNLNRFSGRGEPDYAFDCFTYGWIAGRKVACIGPETQVVHHLGYDAEEVDRFDIELLRERFDIAVPDALKAAPGVR